MNSVWNNHTSSDKMFVNFRLEFLNSFSIVYFWEKVLSMLRTLLKVNGNCEYFIWLFIISTCRKYHPRMISQQSNFSWIFYGKIHVWGNLERNARAIDKLEVVYSCVKYRKYGNKTNVITLQIFEIVQNETMNHFAFVISLLFQGIFQPK